MPNVGADQADTYKCYAVNEFGKAVVTAALNIIEGKYIFVTVFWHIHICILVLHLITAAVLFWDIVILQILVGFKKSKALQESRTGKQFTERNNLLKFSMVCFTP